jgi:hypothetical protein
MLVWPGWWIASAECWEGASHLLGKSHNVCSQWWLNVWLD